MPSAGSSRPNSGDEATRIMFSVTAVVIFIITLCMEACFAASEKFIGVNVSEN